MCTICRWDIVEAFTTRTRRARIGGVVFVAALAVVVGPRVAFASSLRRECRQTCHERIRQCIDQGGRRCRSSVRRDCREHGLAACQAVQARVALCVSCCDARVAEDCALSDSPFDRAGRGCRRGILNDCRDRDSGLAACAAAEARAQACRETCGPIVSQCERTEYDACSDLVWSRCRDKGTRYCDAAAETVNGCNRVFAMDLRGTSLVEVRLEGIKSLSLDFAPECILVSPGTVVRFTGPFESVPLVGGVAPNPAPDGPFATATTTGSSKDVAFPDPGTFPYFALGHTALFEIAWGAVIVDADATE